MKENTKVGKNFIKKLNQVFAGLLAFVMFFMSNGFYSQAADLGENVGNWFLEQLFWLAIVAIIIVVVFAAVKRNYVGLIISIIVGAIVLWLIQNPEQLSILGEQLGGIFLKKE